MTDRRELRPITAAAAYRALEENPDWYQLGCSCSDEPRMMGPDSKAFRCEGCGETVRPMSQIRREHHERG